MKSLLLAIAIGLTIALAVSNSRVPVASAADAPVTFNRQIAPVLYKNCSVCHHPGGAGPFSLLTYADARRWAPQIVRVTQSRFMPPWLPEPGYGDFADQRRLSSGEIALIRQWVTAGMPEGNPDEAPVAPSYSSTWLLGTPDLILSVQKPFQVPASGNDVFRNFILPYPLQQTHYIRALQILPGTPRVVHHANILIDRTASLRHTHPNTWQQGIAGMELMVDSGDTFDPDSHFLFWKPDSPALIEPSGMPWRLDPGNDLILNMHLKPTGKPEIAKAQIGLYFTDKPPTQHPMLLELEDDSAIDIPPGDRNFTVQDHMTLPIAVKVLGVYPHAHYLGKDLQGYATLPNGRKMWLIWIRNWDIDRQSVYSYRHPLLLPKGTVLHMRYTYDNSASNIHNPNSPPLRVKGGNRSTDEMGHLWLQVLPVEQNPPSSGLQDGRLVLEQAWMEDRLRKDPGDPIALYNLSAVDLAEGDYTQSITIDQHLLQRDPADTRTLTALGVAQERNGETQKAEASYRKALTLDPSSTDARFDLGRLDLKREAFQDAETQFRTLLASYPKDAAAHTGLGVALFNQDKLSEAQQEFQRALAQNPQDFTALSTLGQIDISSGNLPQAIQNLKSALQLQDDPDARQWFAMAYAQSGNFTDSAEQLQQVLRVRPRSAITYALLSRVYSSMGRWTEAMGARRQALDLNPGDADGWNDMGVLEVHLGHYDLARDDFMHALQIDPHHALAQANLQRLQHLSSAR